MRKSALLLVFAGIALAGSVNAEEKKADGPADAGSVTTLDQMKFVEVIPGVVKADLVGDATKGAHKGVTKFKAGHMNPLHHHTSDVFAVVISGTMIFQPEGGAEIKAPAGSVVIQKGGKKHVSGCTPEAECVFFEMQEDKFDLIPAEAPKK